LILLSIGVSGACKPQRDKSVASLSTCAVPLRQVSLVVFFVGVVVVQEREAGVIDDSKRDGKRKQILQAAVQVFATRGYHGCRISDVADEAGVAYGLVYHYFGNKDGLLAAIFDTNWDFFLRAVDEVANQPDSSMYERLRQIVEVAFHAFEVAPLVVKVLVQEFGRHSRVGDPLSNAKIAGVLSSVARIFEDGQRTKQLSPSLDPYAMSVIFLGSLETAFVSYLTTSREPKNGTRVVSLTAMKGTLLAMIQRSMTGP
jgi:TetR/AcrR family transcriptional regulator, fatty acid metabolism regulator protein